MSTGALRAILKENKTVPTTLERKWLWLLRKSGLTVLGILPWQLPLGYLITGPLLHPSKNFKDLSVFELLGERH